MPVLDTVLEGAALVARQATSVLASTSAAATTSTSASAASGAPSTTLFPEPSTTFSSPPTTTTSSGSKSPGGSSPLLFFVALGFGVVFTNLWIIVGVKYCFRYNARARQMRLAAEEGDQINMENMPHPRRRRREKKLMTIDEVNEKFPMMKYKTWVASRALNGLPTRGGVDVPSRPSSIRSAAGVIASVVEPQPPATPTTIATADVGSTPKQSKTTDTTKTAESAPAAAGNSTNPDSTNPDSTTTAAAAANRVSVVSAEGDAQDPSFYSKDRNSDEHEHHSEDEDDEHINSALPPECVGTSGDTCAICIDTLEDDDDVRGLTCGHAFHAVCLDPWLTSRRACCPLCKADYYTPKPRAPPAEGAGDAATQHGPTIGVIAVNLEPATTRHRNHFMGTGISSWAGMRGPGSYLPTRFMMGSRSAAHNQPDAVSAAPASGRASESQPQLEQPQPTASRSNWVSNLRPFRRRQDQATPEVSQPAPVATPAGAAANAEVTPSQLEAGVRN